MEPILIREASESDQSEVIELISHHIGEPHLDAYIESIQTHRLFNTDDPSTMYVAVDQSTSDIVGVLAIYYYDTVSSIQSQLNGEVLPPLESLQGDAEFDRVGYLATGYTHQDWLRQGVGRLLRDRIERDAQEQGVDAIFAEVWIYDDGRDARRPLRQSGYTEIFRSDKYWPSSVQSHEKDCSVCSDDCDCIGAIYRKKLSTIL